MDTMSLRVANGISSHQRPVWNKWKKKRETEKVQRVEAVEAIVDLIAQARKRGDTETVEKLTRARMNMEDPLQVPYQSEMDWNGNEEENEDDRNRTWESLTSANSLVDVARLHCNIELEQDKASLCRICFLLPSPTPTWTQTEIPTSTSRRNRTQRNPPPT
jgi:DNA polymerase gamma 1